MSIWEQPLTTLCAALQMTTITGFKIEDLRFPTSLSGDGTDASELQREVGTRPRNPLRSTATDCRCLTVNKSCDYSSAYVTLTTDGKDIGYG